MDKIHSLVVNLGIDWLAKCVKDICSSSECTTVEAKRQIAWTLSTQEPSVILAGMFNLPVSEHADIGYSEFHMPERENLILKTYRLTERNVSLLSMLEFYLDLSKSAVINLSIEWLARTFRDLSSMTSCSNVEIERMILDQLSEESYSNLVASIVLSSPTVEDGFDQFVGMKA